MKKFFSKKNELKKGNKSGNSREADKITAQDFGALVFLTLLDKHLKLGNAKSNFPELILDEPNKVSFQQSAPSNNSTDGCNTSKEKDDSEKCSEAEQNQEDFTGSSSFSRKRELFRQKPLGQKRKQLKTNDVETWKS